MTYYSQLIYYTYLMTSKNNNILSILTIPQFIEVRRIKDQLKSERYDVLRRAVIFLLQISDRVYF